MPALSAGPFSRFHPSRRAIQLELDISRLIDLHILPFSHSPDHPGPSLSITYQNLRSTPDISTCGPTGTPCGEPISNELRPLISRIRASPSPTNSPKNSQSSDLGAFRILDKQLRFRRLLRQCQMPIVPLRPERRIGDSPGDEAGDVWSGRVGAVGGVFLGVEGGRGRG